MRLALASAIGFAGVTHSTTDFDLDFVTRGQSGLRSAETNRRKKLKQLNFPFVVLDLETTGFTLKRDEIIEIGLIRVEFSKSEFRLESAQYLIRPIEPIPRRIRELTGITSETVREAPRLISVLPKVKEFIGDAPIVAHNAGFDNRFLEQAAEQLGITFSQNEWICSLKTVKNTFPGLKSYKLENLGRILDISVDQSHRALADATAALGVFAFSIENGGIPETIDPVNSGAFNHESSYSNDNVTIEYSANLENEIFVFTGFRDAILAARIEETGGMVVSNIRKDVTRLLVAEVNAKPTGKVKKAIEYGIVVQSKQDFESVFYFHRTTSVG